MIFEATPLEGVWVINTELVEDDRGSFGRTFCEDEFRVLGIDTRVAQCSVSRNPRRWTLRGIHLQTAPHGETKLVRCTTGAVFDVAVDLRDGSATFGEHFSVTLSGSNQQALLMPPGVAHGFLTLEPQTDVWYQMSVPFAPDSATGVRWDDPDLAIPWPRAPRSTISARDGSLPSLREFESSVGEVS